MRRRLPPLAGIRAFEAAARHESFTAAADELNVTQSAISHQVKRLEAYFGRPLFLRSPQGLTLTDDGRIYQRELTALLDRLDASSRRLSDPEFAAPLRIRATPAFITRWLLPRMHGFQSRHPDIDYEISIGMPPTDFSRGDVDVFVHWGAEPVEGARVEPFLESARAPVACPDLLRRLPPIREPADLLGQKLLHDVVEDGWSAWFKAQGVVPPARWRGPRFEHCELVLTAALAGQGICLPYLALIEPELKAGELVRLFDAQTQSKVIYSLAYPQAGARDPRIIAFRDWILGEVALPDAVSGGFA